MMRFLASVISADEARALLGVADVIDVKNPSSGAMGAPDVKTVEEVREAIGDTTLSAALGEASGLWGRAPELAVKMSKAGADILKISVFDMAADDVLQILTSIRETLPENVRLVAATYVDAPNSSSVTAFDLPFLASAAGADGILLDTRRKNRNSILRYMKADELKSVTDEAQGLGITMALAGSLDITSLRELSAARPDYVGFRSAITLRGERDEGGVDIEKARDIKKELDYLSNAGDVGGAWAV